MKKIIYFFICTLILACNVPSKEEPKLEIFELSKATYKGKPIIGDRNIFEQILSNPVSKIDSCNQTRIGIKQGYWAYDCITPVNDVHSTYSTYKDIVFLSKLNFFSSAEKIITPKITLSNKTTLEQVILLFPDSYPELYNNKNALKRKTLEKVYINDDLPTIKRSDPNHLELTFKNKYLVSLRYYWKPEMNPEQISIMEKRNNEAKEWQEQQELKSSQ